MMSKRASAPQTAASNGTIIIWLAGLVFGVSAGLLMVYHFLMADHAASGLPATQVAAALPADGKIGTLHSTDVAQIRTVNAAHTAAMKEALKGEAN